MNSKKVLKLGTRRSLLAWSQSSWVAREVERENPGVTVELVGIETRGDKIQNVSLQKIEGKEFFVAELDDALRAGSVDFNVHSMKDLSLDRPGGFYLGAVPKRENSRDVILFSETAIERLKKGEKVRVGTSSPRRLENLPIFLDQALPYFGVGPKAERCQFVEIRGNVNTRLSRVHEPESSERKLDGVVLAFAGLIRLWRDEKAKVELSKLLQGVRWMILPLRECPSAPAQGALAVECREDDSFTRAALSRISHDGSRTEIGIERSILRESGGGCHQRFGASAAHIPGVGEVLFVKGKDPQNQVMDEVRFEKPAAPKTKAVAWNGIEYRKSGEKDDVPLDVKLPQVGVGSVIIAAHSRALTSSVLAQWKDSLPRARVFTTGVQSWFRLAQKGVWVESCGEELGIAHLEKIINEEVLQLSPKKEWFTLTHKHTANLEKEILTYQVSLKEGQDDPQALKKLQDATHVYWSSASQFEALSKSATKAVSHACGAGKTALILREKLKDQLNVFPSEKEWKSWLGI